MNKIVFPLKSQMKGTEVGDLHQALIALGFQIAAKEQKEQRFGTATRKSVLAFQEKHGLELSGAVDQKTAARINRELKGRERQPGRDLVVKGRVMAADGPLAGVLVRAVDQDQRGENLLGEARTEEQGNYEIRYTEQQFRRTEKEIGGPDLIVRVYSAEGKVIAQSKRKRNANQEETLNLTVGSEVSFTVSGTIRRGDGRPAVGALVRAYDQDLRKKQLLGKTTTDAAGHYSIAYTSRKFLRAEKTSADLYVVVVNAKAKELASSVVIFDAPVEATVDLTLPPDGQTLSEFELLLEAILPLLTGQGKAGVDLRITELEEQDIAFLARESGQPQERIAFLLAAAKAVTAASGSGLPPIATHVVPPGTSTIPVEAFYGWFRDGQPQQFSELIRQSTDDLMASMERAIAQAYIPAFNQSQRNRLHHALDACRIDAALEPAKDGEAASLGDALRMIPQADRLELDRPDGPGRRLASLVVTATPESGLPWKKIRAVVGDDELFGSLQRSLGLMTLTRGYVPLMQALQQIDTGAADASLADLVTNDAKDWIELAKKYGAPKEIEAATDEARYIQYGQQIARTIELMHPTPFIQHRIASDRIPIAADLKEPISAFLSANPALRFKEKSVLVFLASDDVNSGGLTEEKIKAITPEMLKIERIARLAPSLEYVGPLLSGGYESARDVVRRHSREVFIEENFHAIGDEAEAGKIYDAAAGVVATTEALVLMHSPRFAGRDLPVIPSIPSPNQQTGTVSSASTAATGTGALVLPANLQQLFGNQDYCECAHGASLYGAAAYLADLLQMLNRGQTVNNKTALQVLLDRRPDLAEIDLSGDNTDIRLPYIDLVLEILEAPSALSVTRKATGPISPVGTFDSSLAGGVVPDAMQSDAQGFSRLGIKFGDELDVRGSANGPWRIRDKSTGLKYRIQVTQALTSYALDIFPQSVAGASKGYRPWSSLLSSVVGHVAESRFPWGLPFDIVRNEVNTWLDHLGATREQVMLAFAGVGRWTDIDIACECLNVSRAERDILVLPPSTAKPDYQDRGFIDSSVGVDGIFDPIAGAKGILAGAQITWEGSIPARTDPPEWHALLKNVSLLRSRARLTHRELLNVLETRFVRGGPTRLEITGDECDTSKMRLETMNASLARRIHLFVRLWRRLGWSTTELDQAIKADATNTSGADNNVKFTESFLLFVANVARLRAATAVPVANLLDLFCGTTLDIERYWDHSGAQPVRILSRYQYWFDNPTLGKPRLAEFRLNTAGDALEAVTRPETGLPKVRISDHLTYVAAALALPENEFVSLLPTGAVCIPPKQISSPETGVPIEVGSASLKDVEIVIGALSVGAKFSLLIQHSDDSVTFEDVPALQIGVPNPMAISSATNLLSRFSYSGVKKFLRATITPTAGTNPSLWATVRVLTAPGVALDELSLANLTILCKYGVLRRITRKPIAELLTLITLSGSNPLAAAAGPHTALALLEAGNALDTLGLSISEADQLLRGPNGSASENLEQRAEALLTTARGESRSIRDESTVAPDQRSALLTKVLTGLGWDERLIANALGAEGLGTNWGVYEAPLDVMPTLPAGVTLPATIAYDAVSKRLTAPRSTRPLVLRGDLAPILLVATGNLSDALHAIDNEAADRETALSVAKGWLRAKKLPIQRVSLGSAPSLKSEVPVEWRGRFFYDRASNELCFVGWMTLTDASALKLLEVSPPPNTQYADAIDTLYTLSAGYPPPASNTLIIREPSAGGLTIEGVLLDTVGLQERCGLILERLLPEWRSQKLRAKLSAALVQELECPAKTAEALLDLPAVPAIPASSFESLVTNALLLASDPATRASRAAFPQAFDAAARLLTLGQFVQKLGMDASQMPWLRENWSGLDLTSLPTTRTSSTPPGAWASLIALASLLALRKNAKVGVPGLLKILAATQPLGIDYPQLAIALGCSEAALRILARSDGLNINTPAWLRNPTQLLQLVTCLDLNRKLNVPASLLVNVKRVQMTLRPAAEAETEVQALRQIALGETIEGNWSDTENKVLDQIRQRRRDATVDYLVHALQVRDANDLYGYYLIDPQMGPCMLTSRIVQAISSVQLFVQRCLMQLEPDAPPNAINKDHWIWMKNYRVWEANRKVLLYPENWIEPELRDDKTPFFEDVVSSLQQGDATSEKAETAMQAFLEKLTDLSKVEVVATCSSYDDENRLLVTHIFARTLSEPHAYWYRQFRNLDPKNPMNSLGTWTSWQAISLDIEGNHLFPFVWQGRLFLFWAIFSEEADEPSAADLKTVQTAPTPPSKFWRLKLAWSEFKSGAWTSRRLSQDDLLDEVRGTERFPTSDSYSFSVSIQESGITIIGSYGNYDVPAATLFFDGHRILKVGGSYADVPVDWSAWGVITRVLYKMNFIWSSGESVALNTLTSIPLPVFTQVSRSTSLLYSAQTTQIMARKISPAFAAPSFFSTLPISQASKATPFFVSDWLHQFFVYPTRQPRLFLVPGLIMPTLQINEVPSLHFYALDWPQASRLRKTLSDSGVDALLSFDSQDNVKHPPSLYFNEYSAVPEVVEACPDGDLEYSLYSASSTYNFELFFHVPFAIACSLSKNQRFEEARQWFHYIFDPTEASADESPARYWRFRPFREPLGLRIDELVRRLADPTDRSRKKLEFKSVIAQWKDQPFKPHLVARMRLRSYMYVVVMKYLDNLIAWADQLFRRDTMESLNEATQLYILAAQILGRRPEGIPPRTRPVLKSFTELAASQLDDLSNALVDAENLIPNASTGSGSPAPGNLGSLYFCVPNNPKLDEYYDRVEDKLFKLRNCMNIDGVVRKLALFAPAIDPALLVQATAAGMDLAAVLADSQAPLPLYRFNVMAQKATELCGEVKSLGAALLGAIEKGDAEALALMRSGHELQMLKGVRLVKEAQLLEAKTNMDALGVSLQSAQTRFTHYVGLVSQLEALSIPTGPVVGPTLERLSAAALETLSTATAFGQAVTMMIDPVAAASMEVMKQTMARTAEALSAFLPSEGMDTARVPMNPAEKRQLDELKSAHDLQQKAADQRLVAQALAMIPDFTLGAQGFSSSPVVQFQLGGTLLSKVANYAASAIDSKASEHTYRATLHSMLAGYQRRAADWLLQAQLACWDIAQIGEQLKASTLRIAIATQELNNHDLQAANAREAEEFMHSKFSNQELYAWMSGQLASLHFQAYQLAYDVAKRAERCFMHELGVDTTFIKFGYWDSLKKGLLAGEMLLSDLKRMEVAYLNQNARELEITKNVSLRELDPLALIQLQETGECEFNIPEVLFDLDFPGHYFRRIKSVSVSVPCVVGSYTSLSGTLTLLSSKVRTKSIAVQENYTHEDNFRASYLPTQSIATSTGQNDSGMFELNFRDERYLPFEGAGVISTWRLELPATFRPFDYSTISDVVLHVRYTARNGGDGLKQKASGELLTAINPVAATANQTRMARLFSLRQEFPTEWHRLTSAGSQEFVITKSRFPFLLGQKKITISKVELYVLPKSGVTNLTATFPALTIKSPNGNTPSITGGTTIGRLHAKTLTVGQEVKAKEADAKWKFTIPATDVVKIDDILMVCHYTVAEIP